MNDMLQMKLPTDFAGPEEWKEYVWQTVSEEEVPYTLAFGRTSMFVRFYETRNQPFPVRFRDELGDIIQLRDPVRTEALEELNGQILADMTQFLLAASQPQPANSGNSDNVAPATPRELVDDLLDYLAKENPYFALWAGYTKQAEQEDNRGSLEEFVAKEIAAATDQDVEFAILMGQLGNLLRHFRDRGIALPRHSFERIWFLHYLRGAERNMQTRAIVQGLTEAMGSCAFA
jgi:hypothetical protein